MFKVLTAANLKNQSFFETEIKDLVCLAQFKLVKKDKLINTFSFVNLPECKTHDINHKNLTEVVAKLPGRREFMPYNKSILTRILYE